MALHIAEDGTRHGHRYENLKSKMNRSMQKETYSPEKQMSFWERQGTDIH
jgi:hypothetical protein